MKKIFTLLIGIIFSIVIVKAQDPPPLKFSYKATITKSNGAIVANKTIGLKIDIDGTFTEEFTPTTNEYGQIDIVIGEQQNLLVIDWTKGEHVLVVWLDVKGGTNYEKMSEAQLLSVPYALYAGTSGSALDAVTISGDQTIYGIKSFTKDIEVNAITVGRGKSGVETNSAFGYQALYSNTTGSKNTANGSRALYSNTTGNLNTADGFQALYSNTTGNDNTANGIQALFSNTTANHNTANGFQALFSNTTGYSNTANGSSALIHNTTGYANAATGFGALYANTTGYENSAHGSEALYWNTTGYNNTATGFKALFSNTKGCNNSAVGHGALYHNLEGTNNTGIGEAALGYNESGSGNTAAGVLALLSNQTGYENSAFGYNTMRLNNTGYLNTAMGTSALENSEGAALNTAIGSLALWRNKNGFGNTALGSSAGHNAVGNQSVFIGYSAGFYETGSNKLFIDNQERSNEEDARIKSLIYGTFDPDPAAQKLTINGNVGIGTINPSTKLDVKGDINFTGSLYQDGKPYTFDIEEFSHDILVNGLTVGKGISTNGWNTAVGISSLQSNTTGDYNTAFGFYTLLSNTIGGHNTATGWAALAGNQEGDGNTANGVGTLQVNISGNSNTAIGSFALNKNNGHQNTAVGQAALYQNTTAGLNTAIGSGALNWNSTGQANTACGSMALAGNKTGEKNTAIGVGALTLNETGSYNTAIGANAGVNTGDLTNTTAIGYGANVNAPNTFVFGNIDVQGWGFGTYPGSAAIRVGTSSANGNGALLTTSGVWTDASDVSKKYDIDDISYGVGAVMRLHPVTYKLKGLETQDIGFIAQEVKEVVPEVVYGADGEMTMSYGQLTSVLVKAIQEQQEQIEELKAIINQLFTKQAK